MLFVHTVRHACKAESCVYLQRILRERHVLKHKETSLVRKIKLVIASFQLCLI